MYVELTFDQRAARNAHLTPLDGILEQLCHSFRKRVFVALWDQKPRAAGRNTLHDQLQGDSGYPAADSRYHREPA